MGEQFADWQRPQFAVLFESDCDYTRPRRGQVRQAVVLSVREDEVIVDLGAKRDGFERAGGFERGVERGTSLALEEVSWRATR